MAPRKIFAGNWKMYTVLGEALDLAKAVIEGSKGVDGREVVLFPPSVHLREIARLCDGARVSCGAQNMYHEKEGAYTGEISPAMVKDAGARYILIGHSERRHVFGETDDMTRRKTAAAFEYGLEPMVCVGELLEEREKGASEEVVERQLKAAFQGLKTGDAARLVVAYEPVWAIGTGKVATPEIADSMHRFIRGVLGGIFGAGAAGEIPILYGGSVKPENIAGLYEKEHIDGVLVGGASLKAQSFLDIIRVNK
ncbi:MAG TPA: triose-phosphate isomerase [Spirochaetes bacterium]|nr:triose-phosphate isomerase [Spirochaetota bacterium]